MTKVTTKKGEEVTPKLSETTIASARSAPTAPVKPVGYRQPPVEHQFRAGKSPNPNGRPKKPAPPTVTATLSRLMNQKIEVGKPNGGKTTMFPIEIAFKAMVSKAGKGDVRAAKILYEWAACEEQLQAAPHSADLADCEEDKEILAAYLARQNSTSSDE